MDALAKNQKRFQDFGNGLVKKIPRAPKPKNEIEMMIQGTVLYKKFSNSHGLSISEKTFDPLFAE